MALYIIIIIIIIITTCHGATQPVLSSALQQYSVYNVAEMYINQQGKENEWVSVDDRKYHVIVIQCSGCKSGVSSTQQVLQQ